MRLKIKMYLMKKVKFIYPEFEIDTVDYPELEGKTLDEIRQYIEAHGATLHPLHAEFDNLMEELELGVKTIVEKEFPEESMFFIQTEEEVNRQGNISLPLEEF
ncbi:MAG: hypothetical protein K9J37_11345 [Saprospiraceae bacterium]|nr:hypothetical protein [Saprospiraceae bacterium]MCF8250500.1 hypothetical protein [Saprospiraceae bacterium]MCF8279640.1 hypothetical protein [Bacteroidales bacterium]MCF8312426.1 hypothetical protein [Saprospiraceae bacterium]MCF8440757.1 hypothetical protein [Saprospiraceae bacterium]